MIEIIRENQRKSLPDDCSKELRDLVDKMLTLDINQRISIQQIVETSLI